MIYNKHINTSEVEKQKKTKNISVQKYEKVVQIILHMIMSNHHQ